MPRHAQPKVDSTILEMAIVGYQSEVEKISAKIADIKERLGQRGPGRPKATAAAATGTDHAGPQKRRTISKAGRARRSEEHTSELQSLRHLVCRLLLEKKKRAGGSLERRRTRRADRPPGAADAIT